MPVFGMLAVVLAAVVVQFGFAMPTAAQSAAAQGDTAALKREQDALFKRVLANPGDVATSFRYAEVSAALEDFEAAVGALERLQFFNPNLPQIALELGVIYFRMGSYAMARANFTKAMAAPDLSPDVRAKVEGYLKEIEKRLGSNQTTGFLHTGVRHQTHASAAPPDMLARGFRFDGTLDKKFANQSDTDWYALGVFRNILDFGTQNGDAWETTLDVYLSKHDKISRLDTALAEIQTGPRFALFPDIMRGWSIRPYGTVGGIHLGDHQYLSSQAAGVSIGWVPSPGWVFEAGYEHAYRRFNSTFDDPTAGLQTGGQDVGYLTASGPFIAGWKWFLRGAVTDTQAQVDWESYRSSTLDLSLAYGLPVLGTMVRIMPFAGIATRHYGGPEPLLDLDPRRPLKEQRLRQDDAETEADIVRKDIERRVGLGLDVQVRQNIGLGIRIQYSKTGSTLPGHETDNLSIYGGPTVHF